MSFEPVSMPIDACSFSRLDVLGGGVEELARRCAHVPDDAAHRIAVDVDVEDVHEDRDAHRARLHEGRLVDFGDHHDLAVGRRDDESVAALARALGIAKEVGDPERDEGQREREQPERPRAARQRQAERADAR